MGWSWRDDGSGGSSLGVGSWGSGIGERVRKNEDGLSLREAGLWSRLAELKDLPAQDSLAAFPEGLGEPLSGKGLPCAFLLLVLLPLLLPPPLAFEEGKESNFYYAAHVYAE